MKNIIIDNQHFLFGFLIFIMILIHTNNEIIIFTPIYLIFIYFEFLYIKIARKRKYSIAI